MTKAAQPLTPEQQAMAASNIGLVFYMLKAMKIRDRAFDDCYESGVMALMRCVKSFDPSRGFTFSTYACRSIAKGFLRALMLRRRTDRERSADKFYVPDYRQPFDGMDEAESLSTLKTRLDRLDERSRDMIERRYWQKQTLEEISQAHGITREGVRQVLLRAVKRLR